MKKSVQKVGMEQLRSCHGQRTSTEELQDSQISEVVIKKAQAGDLPRILEIYAYAREFMKRTGNPNQWKENAPQKRCWKRISVQDSYMSSDREIE